VTRQEPNKPNPTILLNKEDLDATLLEYSREHFATAQGTPFTTEPLARLLQYDGLTPFGDRILQGRPNADHLQFDEPTKTLLQHMQDKTTLAAVRQHPLDYTILMNRIKKWPERTMTSPSGRHLGIYKTLQRHIKEKKKNETATDAANNDLPIQQGWDILYLIFDILTLTLRHSYTLEQWKTVWTMFIEKDPGNPDLQRLQCLMIFEADWQLLLKWHSAYGFLLKAEEAKTLTPDQGGGRKGCSAIDQALQQITETEITQLTQNPSIILFLNLRHCFDYMVEACHNIACRRQGVAGDYL